MDRQKIVWYTSYEDWSETKRCFITFECHLCFRIALGSSRPGEVTTKWYTSATGLF